MERPLETLTPDDWRAYWKKNKPLREAWTRYRAYMLARDGRGTRLFVFMWGWAAAERAHREMLRTLRDATMDQVRAQYERAIALYEKKTGIYLLD